MRPGCASRRTRRVGSCSRSSCPPSTRSRPSFDSCHFSPPGTLPCHVSVAALPGVAIVRREVPTPFEQKGLVMRTLVERANPAELFLLDGVKTVDAAGWTLVLPDPETPVTHIHAEAKTRAEAEERVDRAARDIEWILAEGTP